MESRTQMMIRYTRSGGRVPPPDREILEIQADGRFTMWRSNGSATYPPTPIGRFAGQIEPGLFDEVTNLADSASRTGDLALTAPPDAAIERVQAGDASVSLGANDELEGVWGPVIEQLRQLLLDLSGQPQAAIAVEVTPDGRSARLVHRGQDPLRIDLRDLSVRAVLWNGYRKEGDWRWQGAKTETPGEVLAGPGWSFDLPFEHQFAVTDGQEVVAYVTFSAYDEDLPVPVSLESPRSAST